MQDEQPLKFLGDVGVAMAKAVRQGIQEHEARMHAQSGPEEPLPAAHNPDDRIPAATLAMMDEILDTLETRVFGIPVAARLSDYPESLVARELAAYIARFRQFIQSHASA